MSDSSRTLLRACIHSACGERSPEDVCAVLGDAIADQIKGRSKSETDRLIEATLDHLFEGIGWRKDKRADNEGVALISFCGGPKSEALPRLCAALSDALVNCLKDFPDDDRVDFIEFVLDRLLGKLGWTRTDRTDNGSRLQ